jgi:type IV secretory pathway TrbD component
MNPFVEECRREWKRLGVPDPVANEMAADLEVDLAEAEADGTSAEEVLGTSVFDAPAFAAAWAAERGVVPPPPPQPSGPTRARRSRAPFVIAGFALVAVVGLVLALLPQPTVSARLAIGAPFVRVAPWSIGPRVRITPQGRVVPPHVHRAVIVPPHLSAAAAREVVTTNGFISGLRILGLVLLIVGLAGTVLTTLCMVRSSRRPAATG